MWETCVWCLGWEDPLRGAWQHTPVFLPGESPWTEEPGRLQPTGSQRAGHDWMTKHNTAELVYNVVFIPSAQQNDSMIHIHIFILSQILCHMAHYRILSRVPCVGPCWLCVLYVLLLLLLSHFSHVRLCATLWTAAHQAPLSTWFFRQKYWNGLPFTFPVLYIVVYIS